MPFILNNVITPLVTSFFVVIGGATPIAILIYVFSKKEKTRLLAYSKQIEASLPILEVLYKKLAEIAQESINKKDMIRSSTDFNELVKAQDLIETNKKFIIYANNYSFMSAVGHFLRMSNYMPKGLSEHKEISKNIP